MNKPVQQLDGLLQSVETLINDIQTVGFTVEVAQTTKTLLAKLQDIIDDSRNAIQTVIIHGEDKPTSYREEALLLQTSLKEAIAKKIAGAQCLKIYTIDRSDELSLQGLINIASVFLDIYSPEELEVEAT